MPGCLSASTLIWCTSAGGQTSFCHDGYSSCHTPPPHCMGYSPLCRHRLLSELACLYLAWEQIPVPIDATVSIWVDTEPTLTPFPIRGKLIPGSHHPPIDQQSCNCSCRIVLASVRIICLMQLLLRLVFHWVLQVKSLHVDIHYWLSGVRGGFVCSILMLCHCSPVSGSLHPIVYVCDLLVLMGGFLSLLLLLFPLTGVWTWLCLSHTVSCLVPRSACHMLSPSWLPDLHVIYVRPV